MSNKTNDVEIRDINVIDMLLIDHRFLKESIEILKDPSVKREVKFERGPRFLRSLQDHSLAENTCVYRPLEKNEEFHFHILESKVQHGIFEDKVAALGRKLAGARDLSEEVEVELKVLAEMVQEHLREEESELLPHMSSELDEETLKEMGRDFMRERKLSLDDLREFPHLQDELIRWKDDVQKVTSQFLAKMDRYVENLRH